MKPRYAICSILLISCLPSFASSLLVPSLQDEAWLSKNRSLPVQKYPSPPSNIIADPAAPDIPDMKELVNRDIFVPNEPRANNDTGLNPDDLLSSGPALEPKLRNAIKQEQETSHLADIQDNIFTQTDIFFSLTWDYIAQELNDKNKSIADQIIASAKDNGNLIEVVIPKESTGAMAAKTNAFLQYLKAGGIREEQISVAITSDEDAAILQEDTILVTIKQTKQEP
ncbi:MAG: hypothetical protein ACK5MJ_08250 [Alphaproteobacteria bacterium]